MTPSLDLVGMVVKDMAKSLAFYRLLGMPIAEGAEAEDHVEVTVGGIRFAWDSQDMIMSFDSNRSFANSTGRISMAFKCDSPADVDKFYKKVIDAGYNGHKEPWDAFWGQRYAVVFDPDGNHVDLFANMS